jgi:hypothetical protein
MLLFQYTRVSYLYKKKTKNFNFKETGQTVSSENELEIIDCDKNITEYDHKNLKPESESPLSEAPIDTKLIEMQSSDSENKERRASISTDIETQDSDTDDKDLMLKDERDTIQSEDFGLETASQLSMKTVAGYKKKFVKMMFLFFMFGVTYFFIFVLINDKSFANFTALLSCMIESAQPIPQFISNCKLKSIKSLSLIMVFCWIFGDVMKFIFLLDESQPLQFLLGTANVIVFDMLIVGQCFLYGRKKGSEKVLEKDDIKQVLAE